MLCSISTSTTSTSGRSTSNWLDKLRCSKGFPTSSATDLDLEQFLAHHTNHNNPIPPENLQLSDPKTTHQPQSQPSFSSSAVNGRPTEEIIHKPPSQEKQLFSIMSNVLAELFVMGGDSSTKQKCSRKQTNPRFCLPLDPPSDFSNSTNYDHNHGSNENAPVPRKNDSASPMSDDNSGMGLEKELVGDQQVKLVENVNCAEEEEEEEEEDKGYSNLSGFSRTEVTVIDTSFARWKFEKMLFRKKNVWKVRDKKGKAMSSGKKKRKASNSIDTASVFGGIDEIKKPKILDGQCGLSKKGSDGANNEEYHENDKSQTDSRKISDTFGKALNKKQATLNLESGSSSVVLIKNIPTGKKSGTGIPRSCPKSTQRQFKE